MKSLKEAGVGKVLLVHTYKPMQVGGAATRIGDNKHRRFYCYLLIAAVKNFVYQPEEEMQKLVKEIDGNKKDGQQPYLPAEIAIGIPYYFEKNFVPDVIKGGGEIFHTSMTAQFNIHLNEFHKHLLCYF